jgi:MarR family transcriptional regulator, negative regulator of the multidrug operon emrRAB
MQGNLKLATVKRSTPAMAAALPDLPMAETVMVRLIRITVSGMTDFFDPVLRTIGLSENSFHVLCLLIAAERGRASPSELSELVGTSRANMTRILDQLEREGYTSRAVEARDARRYVIEITAKGRRVTTAAVPKMVEPLKRAFSDLTPEEFATLETLLRKTILSFDQGAQALKESA